jgi:hypothetical protein
MAKKKNLEKGYSRVKRNIDFSNVRKHQRITPKREKFEGRKNEERHRDTNKYKYKKKEDINRRNRKQKREKEK